MKNGSSHTAQPYDLEGWWDKSNTVQPCNLEAFHVSCASCCMSYNSSRDWTIQHDERDQWSELYLHGCAVVVYYQNICGCAIVILSLQDDLEYVTEVSIQIQMMSLLDAEHPKTWQTVSNPTHRNLILTFTTFLAVSAACVRWLASVVYFRCSWSISRTGQSFS